MHLVHPVHLALDLDRLIPEEGAVCATPAVQSLPVDAESSPAMLLVQ